MSFDVFLIDFRAPGHAAEDAKAALETLSISGVPTNDDVGHFSAELGDRGSVELYAKSLKANTTEFGGGMFAVRGLSPMLAELISEFARASSCVIVPASDPPITLVPREDLMSTPPDDLKKSSKVLQVESGAEVLAALNGGYESWREYRDRVVKGQASPK
jgi:hypothetical protein